MKNYISVLLKDYEGFEFEVRMTYGSGFFHLPPYRQEEEIQKLLTLPNFMIFLSNKYDEQGKN